MKEKTHCCPNCDVVMALHYDPDDADVEWYECSLCGHRTDAEGFRSIDETWHRLPSAR